MTNIPIWMCIPFAGLLLCIAVFPLVKEEWWEKNRLHAVIFWSLLFIIPGIVKAYEYRMIPYLLAENPEMSKEEAFAISKQMMSGQKWRTFVLDLSFFGWILLSGFTCGILAIFYVNPYVFSTQSALYERLRYGNVQRSDENVLETQGINY